MEAQEKGAVALELLLDEEFDRLYERLKRAEDEAGAVQWGGFFRRTCAFFVDVMVLSILSLLFFYLAYVGYSVGLAAHNQTLSEENRDIFLLFLALGSVGLATGYFVLFHGMEGKTVGKWLLGLRVVGPGLESISYSRALLRWLGTLISAVFGLGFLWILFSREKRGWHDLLAGTWVIRERSSTSNG